MRSSATAAVASRAGTRPLRRTTFNGSPATPETVRYEKASAARRMRARVENRTVRGRGKHHDHAQVRVRCQQPLASSASGTAIPRRRPVAIAMSTST
jgi:hypothetical protein